MRQSLIAVCLLFLTPASVMACYEHDDPGAGWIDDQSSRWSYFGMGAKAGQQDRLLDLSVFAGGSGMLILLGVGMRTLLRAAPRAAVETLEPASQVPLAIPSDRPPCEPQCVLAGFDSQDDVCVCVEFREVSNESFDGVTFPVETFHSLV